jgi:DNA-binding NarL/FixJ family response regulator
MREVGERLCLSTDTVRSRLCIAFRHHDVPNQPALVNKAWQDGVMLRPEILELQAPHERPRYVPRVAGPPRQRGHILVLLAEGLGQREIAEVLGIQYTGVKSHIRLLYKDMGLVGTPAAGIVHRAWQLGWLPRAASTGS